MCIKTLKYIYIYVIFKKKLPSIGKIGYRTHSVKCPSDGYPMSIRWPSDVIWCEGAITQIRINIYRTNKCVIWHSK